jgi:hypothetical protein
LPIGCAERLRDSDFRLATSGWRRRALKLRESSAEVTMPKDTSEYSSSKSPETAGHAEERDNVADPRLIPGGAEPRTPSAQGMAGLERETVPDYAADTDDTRDGGTGKEEPAGE